jgi:hypothetical protein
MEADHAVPRVVAAAGDDHRAVMAAWEAALDEPRRTS